jgi:hypothetical protein
MYVSNLGVIKHIRYATVMFVGCIGWALTPISVISDIGLSLISDSPISDSESGVQHYI